MNNKIKNVLLWVGTIGAAITSIAYLAIIIVLIIGLESQLEMEQMLLVSILGALTGLSITFMLRGQGVAFAKNEPGSKEIMQTYYRSLNKHRKPKSLHTIKWHVITQSIKDIVIKASSVAISTYFSIFIIVEGSGDAGLIGIAVASLSMFICFGVLAMAKAYDYYLEEHLEAVKELTIQLDKKGIGDK